MDETLNRHPTFVGVEHAEGVEEGGLADVWNARNEQANLAPLRGKGSVGG